MINIINCFTTAISTRPPSSAGFFQLVRNFYFVLSYAVLQTEISIGEFVICSLFLCNVYVLFHDDKKFHFGKNLIREFVGTVSFLSFVLLSMTSESYLYSFAVTLTFHGPKIRAFCANYLRNSKKEETTVHEL